MTSFLKYRANFAAKSPTRMYPILICRFVRNGLVILILAASGLFTTLVGADTNTESDFEQEEILEEVITIGTRTREHSTLDSTVPIQMYDQDEIASVATATDLIDVLQRLIPSFNVSREPISDGASFMRPPFVRGLDSDKLLVLVNGKRRHKGALVRLGGGGTHGADISSIPVSALQSVELLQDGASAQHGSDAIAGVVNFRLKDDPDSVTFSASTGEYSKGGGDLRLFSNLGLPLLDGFVNLSFEYSDVRGTSRGQRYDLAVGGGSGLTPAQSADVATDTNTDGIPDRFGPDVFTEIRDHEGNLLSLVWGSDGIPDDSTPKFKENLPIPEQVWGIPASTDAKISANFRFPFMSELLGSTHLYGFGNWRTSESTGSFFYRRPGVGQLNPVRLADGSIFNPRDRFPGGFTPKFTGNIDDIAAITGLAGDVDYLSWDFSVRFGYSAMSYELINTWNPSMGPSSPTTFRPGELRSAEFAVNGDFTWELTPNWETPIVSAFGFEYRKDSYEILAGDSASYMIGPFAFRDPFNFDISEAEVNADPNDDLIRPGCRLAGHEELIATDPNVHAQPGGNCIAGDPIYNVMSVGSNGFPGYDPKYAVDRSRGGAAVYVELSMDPSRWVFDLAGRLEDAGSYGFVSTWKLASKYDLTDTFSARSSITSGFKAPTIGQESTVNVSTRINSQGNPAAEGIFPPSHPVASYFGAKPLDPENSRHLTLGLVVANSNNSYRRSDINSPTDSSSKSGITGVDWNITVDGYFVTVRDRLTLSSPFTVDEQALQALNSVGIREVNSISQVVYFTNALTTRSVGLEMSGAYKFISPLGATEMTATINWNKIKITDQEIQTRADGSTFELINAEGLFDFEHTWPRYRGVFTVSHFFRNDVSVMLRGNRFGSHQNASNSTLSNVQSFAAKWQWDAHMKVNLWQNYHVITRVTNIFDSSPDPAEFEACCGRVFRSDSLVPWQGPYYSVTFTYQR